MPVSPLQKRAAAWLGIAIVAGLLLWLLAPVLTPFVVAAVLAYALAPLVDRLDRARGGLLPRVLAVLLAELALIVAVLGLVLLIVPIVAQELPQLRARVPALFDALKAWLAPLAAQWGLDLTLDLGTLRDQLLGYLNANWQDSLASLLNSVKLGGSFALALVGNALLIPVALFYLLLDWDGVVQRVRRLIPPRMLPSVEGFASDCDHVLGQYLRGQLLVMLAMAVFFSVGLALFGLDVALPAGVFTGLSMFVPYLGFGAGLLLATLAGLLQFASMKALVMVAVVFGIGQLLESLVLTPRLVGQRIGLHPLASCSVLSAFWWRCRPVRCWRWPSAAAATSTWPAACTRTAERPCARSRWTSA